MNNLKFAREVAIIKIKTPIASGDCKLRFQEAIDFADCCNAVLQAGYNADGEIVYDIQAQGNTTVYCRGIIAEIKFLIKKHFKNCKIEVKLSAY